MTKEFNFYDRIDQIFEQGMPTRAQIYDAFNKAVDVVIKERMQIETKFPTREEIKKHFTTTHKPWKEEPYKKINYDRVTGAEWAFEWIRNRIKGEQK